MLSNTRKFFIFLVISSINFITPLYAADKHYYIFSGNSNKTLAENIAYHLRTPLGNAQINHYGDGEINITIHENVKNKYVFIIQSTCKGNNVTMNDSIMELYLLTRALKRNGAKVITAIIPYLGYTRQDRKDFNFAPISTSDIAMLLEKAGLNNIITIDLHSIQIQGFFHYIPVDNIYASTITAPYFATLNLKNPVVVALHSSGMLRAENFKKDLTKVGIISNLALVIRQRSDSGKQETNLIGKVKGRDVIIVDDLCDTGSTLRETTTTLKQAGALNVYAAITHPMLSDGALEKIAQSDIKEMVTIDTIPIKQKLPNNIKQLSAAPLLAELIRNMSDEL